MGLFVVLVIVSMVGIAAALWLMRNADDNDGTLTDPAETEKFLKKVGLKKDSAEKESPQSEENKSRLNFLKKLKIGRKSTFDEEVPEATPIEDLKEIFNRPAEEEPENLLKGAKLIEDPENENDSEIDSQPPDEPLTLNPDPVTNTQALSGEEEKKIEKEVETHVKLDEIQEKYARVEKLLQEKNQELEKVTHHLESEQRNRKDFNKVKDLLEKELKEVKDRTRQSQVELNNTSQEIESHKKRITQLEEKIKNTEKHLLEREEELDTKNNEIQDLKTKLDDLNKKIVSAPEPPVPDKKSEPDSPDDKSQKNNETQTKQPSEPLESTKTSDPVTAIEDTTINEKTSLPKETNRVPPPSAAETKTQAEETVKEPAKLEPSDQKQTPKPAAEPKIDIPETAPTKSLDKTITDPAPDHPEETKQPPDQSHDKDIQGPLTEKADRSDKKDDSNLPNADEQKPATDTKKETDKTQPSEIDETYKKPPPPPETEEIKSVQQKVESTPISEKSDSEPPSDSTEESKIDSSQNSVNILDVVGEDDEVSLEVVNTAESDQLPELKENYEIPSEDELLIDDPEDGETEFLTLQPDILNDESDVLNLDDSSPDIDLTNNPDDKNKSDDPKKP